MPFIVYQVLHYILPGLTRREKRALFWIIPGATLFFLGGTSFAYLVMIPPSISFLFRFWHEYIEQMWTIEKYLRTKTRSSRSSDRAKYKHPTESARRSRR